MILQPSDLKISQRLAIGFGLMALAVLITCCVSVWNSHRVRSLSEQELTLAQRDLLLSSTMQVDLQRQDIAIRNAGLDSDPSTMQVQANLARKAAKQADTVVEALLKDPRPAAESELLQSLRKLNADAFRTSEQALGFALAFQPEEAIKVINEKLQPLSLRRAELVARFESDKRRRLETATHAISTLSTQALVLTVLTGVVGLAVATLCAVLVGRSILTPLRGLVKAANDLAGGDLTVTTYRPGNNEIATLSRALDRMAQSLRSVISTVHTSARETYTASTEIASGNRDLSERTERQAASLQGTVSTVASLSSAVRQNAVSADQAKQLAMQAVTIARAGGDRVSAVADTMNEIAKSSLRMGEIVSVIDGIAFQTNILALNASVEAARAGDHGRGFAVVASEVRGLSQRSTTAAQEIRALIENNTHKVADGSSLAEAAAATMKEIVQSSSIVAEIVTAISAVSSDQAASLGTVSASISRIDEMTQQNAALVEQAAAAASSLELQTQSLNDAVSSFKTEATQPRGPAAFEFPSRKDRS